MASPATFKAALLAQLSENRVLLLATLALDITSLAAQLLPIKAAVPWPVRLLVGTLAAGLTAWSFWNAAAKAWQSERSRVDALEGEALLSASRVGLVYETSTIPLSSEPVSIEIHNDGDTIYGARLDDFYVPGFAPGKGIRIESARIERVPPVGALFRHTVCAGDRVDLETTLADVLKSYWRVQANSKLTIPVTLNYRDSATVEWQARFEIVHDLTLIQMRLISRSRFPS